MIEAENAPVGTPGRVVYRDTDRSRQQMVEARDLLTHADNAKTKAAEVAFTLLLPLLHGPHRKRTRAVALVRQMAGEEVGIGRAADEFQSADRAAGARTVEVENGSILVWVDSSAIGREAAVHKNVPQAVYDILTELPGSDSHVVLGFLTTFPLRDIREIGGGCHKNLQHAT